METKYLFPETSGDMVGVMGDHVGVIYEVFDESKKMLRKQKNFVSGNKETSGVMVGGHG